MHKKLAIIVSPNYQHYAEIYWCDCIESLRRQDWPGETKIFITDNQSTESSFAFLKETAPEVEIIRNQKNDGFAKGINDAIKSALKQGYSHIVLFNMDTVVEKDCVSRLIEAGDSSPCIAAVQARIMFWSDRIKINSLGNMTHFLGFGFCNGYGEKWPCHMPPGYPEIGYPSGAAVLLKGELLDNIGLFDEEYWMYNEDQDLGWRIWLAGLKCVVAPEAVVYHKYAFSSRIRKYYWMDRNRILSILKHYQLSTLFLIAFAFLIMEIGLFVFALGRGLVQEKMKVYLYFLKPDHWRYILHARRKSQAARKVADKDILHIFSDTIWYEEIDSFGLKAFNAFFCRYWKIIKLLIRTNT